jgi:hypothetical protein
MITSGTPPQDMIDHISNEKPDFIVQAGKSITPTASIIFIVFGVLIALFGIGVSVLVTIFAPEFDVASKYVYICYGVFGFPTLMGLLSIRHGAKARDLPGPWVANLKKGLLVYHSKHKHHIYSWDKAKFRIDNNKKIITVRVKYSTSNSQMNRSDKIVELAHFEEIVKKLPLTK